jgi:MinD superfamily P-loop ATPase
MNATIAIASGKGGTGKTTLSVNLAAMAASLGHNVHLCDCDVEEPNSHLFLNLTFSNHETVTLPLPVVDHDLCEHCGLCSEICEFHAIACMPERTIVFADLCHACSGCWLVCSQKAIAQGSRDVGVVEVGTANGVTFTHGRLRVGETQVPPLIEAVKATRRDDALVLLDAPPGATCPVVATLQGCDLVLLVTEPTPFGLHDLKVAVELTQGLNLPFAVVVNREGSGDDRVQEYCQAENITLLPGIPFSRDAAVAGSNGDLLIDSVPDMRGAFSELLSAVLNLVEEVKS